MEIANILTQQLGISDSQAKGGAGALFSMAQKALGADDFGKVSEVIPGMDDLLGAAPKSGGLGGVIGGLASSFGGEAGKLGGLASLGGQFSKLGLDSDMIGKFVPIILSFVQSKGGDGIKDLLAGVLK
jgi:hypothetical protein